MITVPSLLWEPLLEGAAQTIAGIIGGYAVSKVVQKVTAHNSYDGAMDFWRRGIHEHYISEGDHIVVDGLISPFTQLFPGDPMRNTRLWNPLYEFKNKITKEEFRAMEFFAAADVALRPGSINGETVVGLYNRYGYVGDGLVGIIPTKYIQQKIPDFFHPEFVGARAWVHGRVSRGPAAHSHFAQKIAARAGIEFDPDLYKSLYYLSISRVSVATKERDRVFTLLGSPWAVTDSSREQYLVQYGYISEQAERQHCVQKITGAPSWKHARVFYDDIASPSPDLGFKKVFLT
jgi:hypothetical protein